jgi:hypothetical protein
MLKTPVFALAALLLLAAGCTGDSDAPPTATPSPATVEPTNRRTPSAEVTSTASPSPTPRPTRSSTSTPAATATDEPSPVPTPTATPRPDGLEFHFGPGVDEFDRALIVRAVEVTSDLLLHEDQQPPSAVFADSSPQRLQDTFANEALEQPWRASGMAQRVVNVVAEASYRGIVINTGSQGWREMDATERLRVVAHEYVHVIQLEFAGKAVADETFRGSIVGTPPAGPFWLLEGSAEVVSWLVLNELQLATYPEPLFDYALEAAKSDGSLQERESFVGYQMGGREGLALSILAVDYLLRSRSLDALFDFWRDTSVRTPWAAPFIRHFGQAPESFYAAFDVYYERVWEGYRP